MNNARLTRSERLKRVVDVLADGRPHSTLDIIRGANVCAVNSCVAELRANGVPIVCKREGDVWFYRLVTPPGALVGAA